MTNLARLLRAVWLLGIVALTGTLSMCSRQLQQGDELVDQLNGFATITLSEGSVAAQGEIELAADVQHGLVAVWMVGSPISPTVHFVSARSIDRGQSFSRPQDVGSGLRLIDPTLTRFTSDGRLFLVGLRQPVPLSFDELDVVLFASDDGGLTWGSLSTLDDSSSFNDRPWAALDATGHVWVTFGRRVARPDGNFDRPLFLAMPVSGASRQVTRVLPPGGFPPTTGGASPRGLVALKNRSVVLGYQEIPLKNGDVGGAGVTEAQGGVLLSTDGRTFGPRIPFTDADHPIASAGEESEEEGKIDLDAIKPFPRLVSDGTRVQAVWVTGGTSPGLACSELSPTQDAFGPTQQISAAPPDTVSLPAATIDASGRIHAFWLRRDGDRWSLLYSRSQHLCRGFGPPQQVSSQTFVISRWPGDFMSATVIGPDVFVGWPVAGGSNPGVRLSIGRGLAS